jgi:predicted nucleic acid-binding protein
MIAYLDSSLLLRILFKETGAFKELDRFKEVVSSRLLRTECMRVIYRVLADKTITEEFAGAVQQRLRFALKGVSLYSLSDRIWSTAEGSFPSIIGTLDALHLATAVELRESRHHDLVILTHDIQLGKGAASLGFEVLGV